MCCSQIASKLLHCLADAAAAVVGSMCSQLSAFSRCSESTCLMQFVLLLTLGPRFLSAGKTVRSFCHRNLLRQCHWDHFKLHWRVFGRTSNACSIPLLNLLRDISTSWGAHFGCHFEGTQRPGVYLTGSSSSAVASCDSIACCILTLHSNRARDLCRSECCT